MVLNGYGCASYPFWVVLNFGTGLWLILADFILKLLKDNFLYLNSLQIAQLVERGIVVVVTIL